MLDQEREKLRAIKTFPSLVKYLRDELDWPIETDDFNEIVFDYEAEELGIDPETAVKIDEIKQLRPLVTNQPWGIFFIKFEPKRLPVVVLRRILNRLVFKKRASASKSEHASWNMNDLLFISNYGDDEQRQITFAHFSQDKERGDLPTLKVLGWDDADTALHLDHCHQELKGKLHWPDNEHDLKDWREKWSSVFMLRHREVITTSKDLAMRLADLARRIRSRANRVLAFETERGHLRKLYKSFQEALIHDLSQDDFADMYAQTIAYGLLAARVSRPMGVTADNVADMIPNPFLKEMLATFLTAGGRKETIDFDELGVQEVVELLNSPDTHLDVILRDFGNRTQQEDPVIHFYEDFLSEYDKKKKIQRGVFFTPRPVVSYIVRSVHELLQNEFELEDGLADITTWGELAKRKPDIHVPEGLSPDEPFVQVLDPATGTATFLVEAIDLIHETMRAKWMKQGHMALETQSLWNEYVPKYLLPRLHGFELMMAPYAIAHMKLGLKLYETGYAFDATERVHVYLTNSLEPASDSIPERIFEQWAPALAHEAVTVNEVKRNKRFTVVIGNPPYSFFTANTSSAAVSLIDRFRTVDGSPIRERAALVLERALQDDFVKFFGFALAGLNETGIGIIGLITNGAYQLNPYLRGLRAALVNSSSHLLITDLGGDIKDTTGNDENVFDIQQQVAVTILSRSATDCAEKFKITCIRGPREFKARFLVSCTALESCTPAPTPVSPDYLFGIFESVASYRGFISLRDLFNNGATGVKTARDAVVLNVDREKLQEQIELFANSSLSDQEISNHFNVQSNAQWDLTSARKALHGDIRPELFGLTDYRPFETRWIYYDGRVVFNPRPILQRHVWNRRNWVLITARRVRTPGWQHAWITKRIPMAEVISSADNCHVFPLLVYPMELFVSSDSKPASNLNADLLGFGDPNEAMSYIYALLHSEKYRKTYQALLRTDLPRLPVCNSMRLRERLADLGKDLISLHLMESPRLTAPFTEWHGTTPSNEVNDVTYSDETVWIDKGLKQGFRSVPENVWSFHIGGYQVCEKWLKDHRGRVLSAEDIIHYQKIVVALNETIRLMKEIDEVIEQHGGWPGAFEQDQQRIQTLVGNDINF